MKRPFSIRRNGSGPDRITLRDTVNVASAGELHQTLIELSARSKDLQIDCDACGYLDTAILQLLAAAQTDWYQRGNGFELVDVPEELESQLLLAGLATYFECVTSQRPPGRRAAI